MKDIFITTGQAAKFVKTSPETIKNYCEKGKLKFYKNPVTRRYSVSLQSVLNLMKKTGQSTKESADANSCN